MLENLQGFTFPFRIDPLTGGVAAQSGEDKIRENIAHILMTGVGERVMRRDYGGGLRQLVHDPNNEVMARIVQHQASRSLSLLEPRIALQELRVELDGATLSLHIKYIVRRTMQAQSFIVPIAAGPS